MDIVSSNRLMPSSGSGDDDSDDDQITDYLSSNGSGHITVIEDSAQSTNPFRNACNNSSNQKSNNTVIHQTIPIINTPPIIMTTANTVPIISVTPHSPGAKYNFILEDTLNQLQNIRESVVQMKNSTVHTQGFPNTSLINSAVLSSSRLFSSCPSLPDLPAAAANCNMWSQQYLINSDRRKSWTAIEDLTDCTNKSSHKSVSLSSLDSEEQESIRVAERHRSSRNSTGGISTHSLNEAELARDLERFAAKRNLAPTLVSRIPLQKSISTPSIAPLRIPGAKEESNAPTSPHLSDSEDDNHDDRSLLCVRDKTEVFEHSEKRRKRGSLFFRKKKDKSKTKGQSTTCDACGTVINLSTVKDHQLECKGKTSVKQSSKSGSGKKNSTNSNTSHHDENRDFYDGHSQHDHSNYADNTPLIHAEFMNEPPIGPNDLGADPMLGIAIEEPDSWSPSVKRDVVKSLKDKQVKRQEHIYEFIMTEKHHCQTLLVMKKVFVESLQRNFSGLHIDRMFPRLAELTELHTNFLMKLRLKQRENCIVDSIADVLVDFFSSATAQKLKSAYGEFCSNHRSALDKFKFCMTSDQTFVEWYKHCLTNPLLKKKGIPECILFVTQRLTKYPLLIDPLLKSSREDPVEQEKLQKAMALVKEMLVDVDACVAEKEKQDRQLEIFRRIDVKSYALYKNKQFKKSEIVIGTNRRLKFEGFAMLMQGRSKMQHVLVVVLSDCLFFLQDSSHNKYTFFTPENKAGVVSLQNLLIREKAGTESRGIYIISSDPAYPEMYELKVQQPKDKNAWIQAIRAAVLECPPDESDNDDLTAEEKQKLIDSNQASMREVIEKLRQKDLEQALLLEEKILLQLSLIKQKAAIPDYASPTAEEFLANFGTYRDLITNDCDTVEIWKRALTIVQDVKQLASSLYTAATGLPVSRSVSSVGEKQSDAYNSPILPKRAETFGGFDEKRNKTYLPWRDAVLSTLPMSPLPPRCSNHKEPPLSPHHIPNPNGGQLEYIPSPNNADNISLKGNNYAALQVSHNLHTLLCMISQQMTTIHHLQVELANYRDHPKTLYKHNDQLEELRNLQDRLQEEKTAWTKQKEQEERELEEKRVAQLELEQHLKKHIKSEQEDLKQQREQLYKKMELLSSQGLLHSPSTPLPIPIHPPSDDNYSPSSDDYHTSSVDGSGTIDRRKDKWKTASTPKTPGNQFSATNAPKAKDENVKQQIPYHLSSLSRTKSDKSSSNSTPASVKQLLPMKLSSLSSSTKSDKHPPTPTGTVTNSANTTPKAANQTAVKQMLPMKLCCSTKKSDKPTANGHPPKAKTPSTPTPNPSPNQNQNHNPNATSANVKPQLPAKLPPQSPRSTKNDTIPPTSNNSSCINITPPASNTNRDDGDIPHMFPFTEGKNKMTSNHSRTGSSPAIMQQHPEQTGTPTARSNTYPKIPDRYRLRSSDAGLSAATTLEQPPSSSPPPPHPHSQSQQENAPPPPTPPTGNELEIFV